MTNIDLKTIKKHLKNGDHQKIADRLNKENGSNYKVDTIYRVLNGKRHNIKIVSIAQDVALENIAEIEKLEEKQNSLKSA